MSLYLRDMLERTVSTAAQAALVVAGMEAFNIIDGADLKAVGVAALSGAFLTVLKCLAAGFRGDGGSASLSKDV